jgi:hypothetical protein
MALATSLGATTLGGLRWLWEPGAWSVLDAVLFVAYFGLLGHVALFSCAQKISFAGRAFILNCMHVK